MVTDVKAIEECEREMLRPIMQHLRIEMPRMGLGDYDQEEDAMRYREAAAIWKQEEEAMRAAARREGVQEGRQEGRQEGWQAANLATITLLFEGRLKRSLSVSEVEVLQARLLAQGVASVSSLLFDPNTAALEAWLRADEAE